MPIGTAAVFCLIPKSQTRDQSAWRLRIREIAMDRPRLGYLRVLVMLKRGGWVTGKKRIYRCYRLEGSRFA